MKNEKIIDLVIWFAIAAVGLVAAYVCFGILSSEASGQLREYSVGGAIAGALVSWGVLTTVYLQLRGSSDELADLRKQNQMLQQKLIRGAPRPLGFDTEVAERQRIVLARPKDWQPKGGTIFDLELGDDEMKKEDKFAANFRCHFTPIIKDINDKTITQNEYYEREIKYVQDQTYLIKSFSHEIVRLGGAQASVDSLKLILKQYVRTMIRKSRTTGKIERNWDTIPCEKFTGAIDGAYPKEIKVNNPRFIRLAGYEFRKGATCYVNDQKRETFVMNSGEVYVKLTEEDVSFPGTLEITLENIETGGIKTNSAVIIISDEVSNENNEEDNLITIESLKLKKAKLDKSNKNIINDKNSEFEKEEVVYQEIARMRVACYHEQLETIYTFDFFDNHEDFNESSSIFNQILSSVRFLD